MLQNRLSTYGIITVTMLSIILYAVAYKEPSLPPDSTHSKIENYISMHYFGIRQEDCEVLAGNILFYSHKYKIPYQYVLGIIEEESAFNRRTISKTGCMGLMQVKASVWCRELKISPKSLLTYDKGLECGVKVLNYYLRKAHGDIYKALYMYSGNDPKYPPKVINNIYDYEVSIANKE